MVRPARWLLPLACALGLAAFAAPAGATDLASLWNRAYDKQIYCATPAQPGGWIGPRILMRWAWFDTVGSYSASRSPTYNPNSNSQICPNGKIRIDRTERITVTNHPSGTSPQLYFHKGGQGHMDTRAPYGHMWSAEITDPPAPYVGKVNLDSNGASPRGADGFGAGRSCGGPGRPAITDRFWITGANPPPSDWSYKSGEPSSRYDKYVNGGLSQSDGNVNYSYLTWSWVAQRQWDTDAFIGVSGGGAVRTILPPGAIFERCDVWAINGRAYVGTTYTGRVTAIYGRVWLGFDYLYGWVLHSWGRKSDNYATRTCVLARVGAESTC